MSKYNSGVYRIEIGDKYYFGLSSDLKRRERDHLCNLVSQTHGNRYMQYAYNKHGKYVFRPLVYCEGDYMVRLEGDLIRSHLNDTCCMNMSSTDESGKRVHTLESRQKMSAAAKGRVISPETQQKMRDAMRGRPKSAEHIRRVADAMRGRKQSADHLKKLSEVRKGVFPNHLAKHVVVFSPAGEFYFASAARAARYVGMVETNFIKCLRGKRQWPRKGRLVGISARYVDGGFDAY